MIKRSIEDLLGINQSKNIDKKNSKITFSFLFFSDVRKDISNQQKYEFMKDIVLFADKEGFESIYVPERHFSEFGSIYANSALVVAYLISQTQRIRFRTAGITLSLHHPAEVVEWWAMNDVLSGGRVDLGFGSGWNKEDFILSPDTYYNRKQICSDRISIVQKLWRGETVLFPGPGGIEVPITVHPRPLQKEIAIWLLVAQNDEAFYYAGTQGYNVFTMLYGINLEAMEKKIIRYRQGRQDAGYDTDSGIVTLMLHTFVNNNISIVEEAVENPFKDYIRSSLNAHVKAAIDQQKKDAESIGEEEKQKILNYAYQRYFKTSALFGSVETCQKFVDKAINIGVNDIACLVDFGVDYRQVKESLPYLRQLVAHYI